MTDSGAPSGAVSDVVSVEPSGEPSGQRGAGPLLLGVRHHGPGSARAVRAALDARKPQVLLIEGPPEADGIIALAGEQEMRPPVALLAHVLDEPGKAAFWPLAEFSPEWVAIRWALSRGVPVRFMDLPAANSLALHEEHQEHEEHEERRRPRAASRSLGPSPCPSLTRPRRPKTTDGEGESAPREALRIDPLAVLAETAGYDDAERWWEDVVEHRGSGAAEARPVRPLHRPRRGDGRPARDTRHRRGRPAR